MTRALIPALNSAVLMLAPRHVARSAAPGTFAELMNTRKFSAGLIVWEGASDATIYADARVNHAFRAWHDAAHVAGEFDFTLAGERAACEWQVRELMQMFPRAPKLWADVIRAEVTGQVEYFAAHGYFPADQLAFIGAYTEGLPNV